MSKADVLDRVAVDLAKGRTQPAIQRLSGLVATHPTDLDLRQQLAAVHRAVGNFIEAGRWSYLQADANHDVVRAFERAFPTAALRLRALRWPDGPSSAATSFARDRLAQLAASAEADTRARTTTIRSFLLGGASLPFRVAVVCVLGLFATVCAIVGILTIAHWLS